MSEIAICQENGICSYFPKGKSTIEIDNSMLNKSLYLQIPNAFQSSASLAYYSEDSCVSEGVPAQKDDSGLKIRISDLLAVVPPQAEAKLVLTNGTISRSLRIKRKGILPNQFKDLTPLYIQIAKDIKKNGYFLVAVPVVLWDASFTGDGYLPNGEKRRWADGTNPDTNLNWGSSTGIHTQLKEVKGWELVYRKDEKESPLRTEVFALKVKPTKFWQAKGIRKPFTVYFVIQAYDYREILKGYEKFADLVAGKDKQTIALPDGKLLDLSQSRIAGLASHFIAEGREIIGHNLSSPAPKGVFALTCFSASQIGPLLVRNNLFPLLFSVPATTSEGYLYTPIVEGIINGNSLKRILNRVAESYYKFHLKYPAERQYINPFTSTFEGALSEANPDWDNDGIGNVIDAEPVSSNPFTLDRTAGRLSITLSNGNLLVIDISPAYILRLIPPNN